VPKTVFMRVPKIKCFNIYVIPNVVFCHFTWGVFIYKSLVVVFVYCRQSSTVTKLFHNTNITRH
jgi:hypothetical protein